MAQPANISDETIVLSQHLLINVAEELKQPLIRIARANEQSASGSPEINNKIIGINASNALQLLDNYIMAVKLSNDPRQLNLESVSVSSVLYDASQELNDVAKIYGVNLELNITGKNAPVAANRAGLHAALVSLGSALIEALPAHDAPQLKLQLAAHPSRYGLVAGVYAQTKQLSSQALTNGKRLQNFSRQPLVNLTYNSGAGIFVADAILRSMDLNLIASRHNRLYGIGTVMQPINQLQLV